MVMKQANQFNPFKEQWGQAVITYLLSYLKLYDNLLLLINQHFHKGYKMKKFDNKVDNRPTSFWNKGIDQSLSRTLTPIHEHEFGMGYDIQYKDSSGKIL